jgi:hypothetical protein
MLSAPIVVLRSLRSLIPYFLIASLNSHALSTDYILAIELPLIDRFFDLVGVAEA